MVNLMSRGGILGIALVTVVVTLGLILSTGSVFACTHITGVTVGAQMGTLTYGTAGSAAFNVTISNASVDGYQITLSVTNLPPETSSSWDQPGGEYAEGTTSATLTVTTTTASPAGNYTFTVKAQDSQGSFTSTGILTINARALTVTGITASDKVYDGTTAATISNTSASLVGLIPPDVVNLLTTGALANFNNKDVGNNKAVTFSGLGLSGSASGNYTLTQPAGITANITAKNLTVTGITASDKVYDGTTVATISNTSASLVGLIPPDVVNLLTTGALANFNNKDVGNNKAVTVTGLSVDNANYSLTQPAGITANITAKAASVTSDVASKTYGDSDPAYTGTLSGFLPADNVTAAYNRTSGETVVDSPYTISATLSPASVLNNYTITYNSANFTIGKRPITVTADPVSKYFRSSDPPLTYKITSGSLVGSDAFTGSLVRDAGENVGIYNITQGTLGLSSNYDLKFIGSKLTILAYSSSGGRGWGGSVPVVTPTPTPTPTPAPTPTPTPTLTSSTVNDLSNTTPASTITGTPEAPQPLTPAPATPFNWWLIVLIVVIIAGLGSFLYYRKTRLFG